LGDVSDVSCLGIDVTLFSAFLRLFMRQ
jgi:hypothetical protein